VTTPLRILIADDHAPTRADVREALEAAPGFSICAECVDAPSAIEAAIRELPDICLLDIQMPGSGISAAWEITSRLPQTRVLMLTVSDDDTHLFAALRAGASGYLLKDMDLTALPRALAAVSAGEAALPRELVIRLVDHLHDSAARRRPVAAEADAPRLTSREWQVLDLMRRGLSTAQIARKLVLAPATIRTHIAAITRKLGAPDRESALRLFDEQDQPARSSG
jgi:DNA-binding NarL/FixJ family response regulator